MHLNDIGRESLQTSASKGFDTVNPDHWLVPFDLGYTLESKYMVPTKLMLIVTEVAEACEEFRKGHNLDKFGEELADIIIRVGQLGIGLGIDLDDAVSQKLKANKTREHQHGGRLI